MSLYYRPLAQCGPLRPPGALPLAGGPVWFTHAARLTRGAAPVIVPADALPAALLELLTAPRAPLAGLSLDRPRLMGVLNVTPDSFSDGGLFNAPGTALAQAVTLAREGANILDIGGESTRPGATPVGVAAEIARTAPVIAAIRRGFAGPISIDTRKAAVGRAALAAGADMVNDVSALGFDARMAELVVQSGAPVCLMHAFAPPETMQDAPRYDDVLLDVHDALAGYVETALAAGIAMERIVIDPGIGFGKTLEHNLALLAGLSLFHGLGCAILLGASRKRFIGTLGGGLVARDRAAGSVGVALAAAAQGVQILRVHDMADTRQALTLWQAAVNGVST